MAVVRLPIQFVHISAGLLSVETFVFGTRLTFVSQWMRGHNKDIDEAARRCSWRF